MTLQQKQSSDQAFWVNKTDANNKNSWQKKTKDKTRAMNKWRSWQEQQLQKTTSTMNHKKHWYLLLLLFEAKSSFIELSSVRNSSWCLLWLVETKWFCHNKCSLDNYALCLQTCMPSSLLVNCAYSAWIEVFQASMLQHFSPFAAKPSAFAFLQCILSRLRWLSVPEILEAQQGCMNLLSSDYGNLAFSKGFRDWYVQTWHGFRKVKWNMKHSIVS